MQRFWCYARLLLAVVAAGCSGTPRPKVTVDSELAKLDQWLPGHYDNRAQIAADRAAGGRPDPEISLTVVAIEPMLEMHAFYLEEAPDEAHGRHVQKRIAIFSGAPEKGKGLIEAQFTLVDPERWRGAASDPDLFKSIQPPDLKGLRGCGLNWKREGTTFTGTGEPDRCSASAPPGAGSVLGAMKIELTASELAFESKRSSGLAKPASGAAPDAFIRFTRKDEN
jgi:hypothetical protein